MTASLLGQFLAALGRRRSTGDPRPVLPDGRPPAGQLPARRPLLALPAPPGADRGPRCEACGYRHPPDRLAPTYATVIDGSLTAGRPRPLRHDAPAPPAHPSPWRYPRWPST
jgi:hypothetical protein